MSNSECRVMKVMSGPSSFDTRYSTFVIPSPPTLFPNPANFSDRKRAEVRRHRQRKETQILIFHTKKRLSLSFSGIAAYLFAILYACMPRAGVFMEIGPKYVQKFIPAAPKSKLKIHFMN